VQKFTHRYNDDQLATSSHQKSPPNDTNLAGSLTSETYPYQPDSHHRLRWSEPAHFGDGVVGQRASELCIGWFVRAAGRLSAYQYGNNLARQIAYNSRLQTSTYSDTDNNTAVQLIGATLGWGTTANNGNLLSAAYVNLGTGTPSSLSFTQNYDYDKLNRLTSAGDSGWSRSFGYDAFGNMWVTANSGVTLQGNTPTSISAFNPNNQIATTPSSYDAAGNQTLVNGDTQVYEPGAAPRYIPMADLTK
jgi:YD repeat-containing protein